jgi:hypothetical protein
MVNNMSKIVKRTVYGFKDNISLESAYKVAKAKGLSTATITGNGLAMSYKHSLIFEHDMDDAAIISFGEGIFELDGFELKEVGRQCSECGNSGDTLWVHSGENIVRICPSCLGQYKIRIKKIDEDDHVTINGGF